MTEGSPAPPFFADNPPNFGDPAFNFMIQEIVKAPALIRRETTTDDDLSARRANDKEFRQSVTPAAWYRYVSLGYHATTGRAFQTIWSCRYVQPLRFHRFIWYNYLYHVDRDMDVPEKLHFWSTSVSQPYLIQYDPTSLDLDTVRFTWNQIHRHFDKMGSSEWTSVGKKKDRKSRSPQRASRPGFTADIPDSTLAQYEAILDLPLDTSQTLADEFDMHDDDFHSSPPVPIETNHNQADIESPRDDQHDTFQAQPSFPSQSSDTCSQADTKKSAIQNQSDVTTNDGTHRITLKWKLTKSDFNKLNNNRDHLISEIHAILGLLFQDDDGYLYKWASEDSTAVKSISQLKSSDTVDFIAPAITKIPSHNLIIVAIRFGFNENPVSWKVTDHVQSALKLNNIRILVSNSTTASGKLVIAGYILLKHPRMTHRHRYLQFLRRMLPDTTPFFDIVYHRKTPMDQAIGHLAVQCGENHVMALCQALSALLTGKQTAVFLPRYSFGNMDDAKIKSHFQSHEKYIKSLHQIPLSPFITNPDKPRIEYDTDGQHRERTTREWAYSLTLSDGTSAQCDVENGGNDKNTYLLIPAAFVSQIKPMLTEYKSRLRLLSQREAKYRDNIPGFPNVIHITSNVQSNIEFMNRFSSEDIWSKAPASVKQPAVNSGLSTPMNKHALKSTSISNQSWPSLVKRPKSIDINISSSKKREQSGNLRQSPLDAHHHQNFSTSDAGRGEGTTASTHSLTNTLRSAQAARLSDLETEMNECRTLLRNASLVAEASSIRLEKTEQHLATTMSTLNDLSRNVANLQTQFHNLTGILTDIQNSITMVANQQLSDPSTPSQPQHNQLNTASPHQQLILHVNNQDSYIHHPRQIQDIHSSCDPPSPDTTSPEKKKQKSSDRQDISDCATQLFTEVTSDGIDIDMPDQQPDQLLNSSPPDVQNINHHDPAGRHPK